jgi:hypothetical protein
MSNARGENGAEGNAPAKKYRGGPTPSEEARRKKGDLRTTLRIPAGQDAEAMRELATTHGGFTRAIRWLLRAAGVIPSDQ